MGKIAIVFGTRPEAIKMAPVVKAFQAADWETTVIVTGQHREMLDQVLELFGIIPDHDLNIMRPGQSLSEMTAAVLTGLDQILRDSPVDYLLVHGDTTSAVAAALAGFYHQIPVAHVEAGLRTGNLAHPFPEEANRRLIDQVSNLFFAPTQTAAANLLHEGVPAEKVYVTGNTVVDALRMMVEPDYQFTMTELSRLNFSRPVVVITAHRRENWGQPLNNICSAIGEAAASLPVEFVFAMHRNPQIQAVVKQHLSGFSNVHLIDSCGYKDFINLLNRCSFIVTDSGGLQEEAAALAKPVIVLREFTERPEGIASGFIRLVGTDPDRIVDGIYKLATDRELYVQMTQGENPYGDGQAAVRIKNIIQQQFNRQKNKPE
ncbi:MAG: UDP-N-acetylglucosamine 2-epimerase (non-hydrolyzing) [Firmicutes bacterium]|nr:UDP-N-acetylglucosamine 2-epimerase (non-hydrolyzing) [Bacillota bacterium]